jgi:16S rRNA (guanine966-N2)-methyltransferase
LSAPRGDAIRPTTGRVKEAVFSALTSRERLQGAKVLDLYSGTGALAIEALSRSAAHAVLVEHDRDALATLRQNLSVTGTAKSASVVGADATVFLTGPVPGEAPFDLVFCDPPYDVESADLDTVIAPLGRREWTAADAIIVVERPTGAAPPQVEGLEMAWERAFGDTLVFFLST